MSQMINKIVQRAHQQHAKRIQRAWKKYYDRVIKRRKAEENRRKLLAEAAEEVYFFIYLFIFLWFFILEIVEEKHAKNTTLCKNI